MNTHKEIRFEGFETVTSYGSFQFLASFSSIFTISNVNNETQELYVLWSIAIRFPA